MMSLRLNKKKLLKFGSSVLAAVFTVAYAIPVFLVTAQQVLAIETGEILEEPVAPVAEEVVDEATETEVEATLGEAYTDDLSDSTSAEEEDETIEEVIAEEVTGDVTTDSVDEEGSEAAGAEEPTIDEQPMSEEEAAIQAEIEAYDAAYDSLEFVDGKADLVIYDESEYVEYDPTDLSFTDEIKEIDASQFFTIEPEDILDEYTAQNGKVHVTTTTQGVILSVQLD